MKELNQRDMRILTRSFLQKLNERVNGNEYQCVEDMQIFEDTELHAFDKSVVPSIVQELSNQGLIGLCGHPGEIKITNSGKRRLQRTVENNAYAVLETLVDKQPDETGRVVMHGKELLAILVDLTPAEINDAVSVLEGSGFVRVLRAIGTRPYTFYIISLTPRGRYEYESHLTNIQNTAVEHTDDSSRRIPRKPTPAGSPYGLTDMDWSIILSRLKDVKNLYVVLGHQFDSSFFDTDKLRKNIEGMFSRSLEVYEQRNPELQRVKLKFKALRAEYGQHLFNAITKDIISADIAVFELSDLNPNVMIEIGVALTWGVATLIIRERSSPTPPSDISGHPWAAYDDNAAIFDAEHSENLISLLELVLIKKRSSY